MWSWLRWQLSRLSWCFVGKKKPEEPLECCEYCNNLVECCWTVSWGRAEYPMCKDCAPQAQKDFFSFVMRTEAHRRKTRGEDNDATGE